MNTKLNQILAEISAGELLDKITILEIKKEKITDSKKLEIGAGQDLELFHNGSNTYITNNTGYMVISSENGSTYNDANSHYFRTDL